MEGYQGYGEGSFTFPETGLHDKDVSATQGRQYSKVREKFLCLSMKILSVEQLVDRTTSWEGTQSHYTATSE